MYTLALKKAVGDREWGMGFRIRQGMFAFRNANEEGDGPRCCFALRNASGSPVVGFVRLGVRAGGC